MCVCIYADHQEGIEQVTPPVYFGWRCDTGQHVIVNKSG